MIKQSTSFWFTGKGICALGLIAAAIYFLLMEHQQHLFAALPYLILLACPLMHLFMHHGHGHRHQQGDSATPRPGDGTTAGNLGDHHAR